MSVQIHHYVMAGYKLPYDTFKHLNDENGDPPEWLKKQEVCWLWPLPGGVHIIHDGMGGKYVMVGEVIDWTGGDYDECSFSGSALDMQGIEQTLKDAETLARHMVSKHCPEMELPEGPAKILIFTHCT